jgi:uncharacterized protein (TIGR02145 family)/prepilin-type N-terminal cleavage/methylation domain-containing protein
MKVKKIQSAFTLAELLIVIVIIGILASLVLASYAGITERANNASLAFDLKNASTKLKAYNAVYGSYPASLAANGCPVASGSLPADTKYCIPVSGSNTVYNYSSAGQTYSLILKSSRNVYYQGTESVAQNTFTPAPYMQTITTANCPSSRTRAQDARDSHTYWVQKLADGKCWMLTNLAYAGGGTNTYGDVKTLTYTNQWSNTDYSTPKYTTNPSATSIFTVEPNDPTSNTDGSGQYGYFYNGCAAQGVQAGTTACANISTPVSSTSISICPSGWVLPDPANDWGGLITNINNNFTNTDLGFRNTWLLVYSGSYNGNWQFQGYGWFWGKVFFSYGYQSVYATNNNISYYSSVVSVLNFNAVRCLAI